MEERKCNHELFVITFCSRVYANYISFKFCSYCTEKKNQNPAEKIDFWFARENLSSRRKNIVSWNKIDSLL